MDKTQPRQNFSDFRVKPPSCYHPSKELLITVLLARLQLQEFTSTLGRRKDSLLLRLTQDTKVKHTAKPSARAGRKHTAPRAATSGPTRSSPERCAGSGFSKEITAGSQNLNMDEQL